MSKRLPPQFAFLTCREWVHCRLFYLRITVLPRLFHLQRKSAHLECSIAWKESVPRVFYLQGSGSYSDSFTYKIGVPFPGCSMAQEENIDITYHLQRQDPGQTVPSEEKVSLPRLPHLKLKCPYTKYTSNQCRVHSQNVPPSADGSYHDRSIFGGKVHSQR